MIIFGKALGNGYAINAIIGDGKIMDSVKQTFISSTFWTERVGYVAALATLKTMKKEKSWDIITKKGKKIQSIWRDIFNKLDFAYQIQGIPALSSFYFEDENNSNILILFMKVK